MEQPAACVVRIADEQGKTLGTGFLVQTRSDAPVVVTCHHVVREREVQVAFPGEKGRPARLLAADPVHDVALLQVEGELPPEARPALLGPSEVAWGRTFRTLGYRPLGMGRWEGIPGEGRVLGAVREAPGRPEVRFMPLILQSQHLRGGMSGAPVYVPELDRVVGMVTAYWDARVADTGFADRDTGLATPSEAVAALCPELLALHPPVTGDHKAVYPFIRQQYPSLKDDMVDFSEDIAEHTRRFVGREFVFRDWLEPFLARHPCGYLRIVAEAGLGKTALAAEVARRYQTPIFFLNASGGPVRAERCLRHLCAELIGRYGLPYDHLPEHAGEDASFLCQLLAEAVEARPGKPLLLVIDGLDEADPVPPGYNWLLLPRRLPQGAYILLTQRPGDYPLCTGPGTQMEEREIRRDDPEQQRDIEAFLRQEAERAEIRRALEGASPPIPVERFVAKMKEASEGNFMYLAYVLADIERREPGFDPLRLEELPRGLPGYYHHFWRQMEKVRAEEG
ncbi:MAG: trypsin-like peptidase domain-containing protein [Chloroflexia bacterium]